MNSFISNTQYLVLSNIVIVPNSNTTLRVLLYDKTGLYFINSIYYKYINNSNSVFDIIDNNLIINKLYELIVLDIMKLSYSNGDYILRFYILLSVSTSGLFVKDISFSKTEIRIKPLFNYNVLSWNTIRDKDYSFNHIVLINNQYKLLITNSIYLETLLDVYGSLIFKLNNPISYNTSDINSFLIYKIIHLDIIEDTVSVNNNEYNLLTVTLLPNFNISYQRDILDLNFYNYSQLTQSLNYYQLQIVNKSKLFDILKFNNNDNFRLFENFVHFGSALLRISVFYLKIKKLQYYTNLITGSQSQIDINKKQVNQIIKTFDRYLTYLYYSTDTDTYPKSGSNPLPYDNSTVTTWYSRKIILSSEYDITNKHRLLKFIPLFIKNDKYNDDYKLFINMIGNYYDVIWRYIKNIVNIDKLLFDYNKVTYLMISLQLKLKGLSNIITTLNEQTLLLVINDKKLIKVLNNILLDSEYILKTRGTIQCLKSIVNCFDLTLQVNFIYLKNKLQKFNSVLYITLTVSRLYLKFNSSYTIDFSTPDTLYFMLNISFNAFTIDLIRSILFLRNTELSTRTVKIKSISSTDFEIYVDDSTKIGTSYKFNKNTLIVLSKNKISIIQDSIAQSSSLSLVTISNHIYIGNYNSVSSFIGIVRSIRGYSGVINDSSLINIYKYLNFMNVFENIQDNVNNCLFIFNCYNITSSQINSELEKAPVLSLGTYETESVTELILKISMIPGQSFSYDNIDIVDYQLLDDDIQKPVIFEDSELNTYQKNINSLILLIGLIYNLVLLLWLSSLINSNLVMNNLGLYTNLFKELYTLINSVLLDFSNYVSIRNKSFLLKDNWYNACIQYLLNFIPQSSLILVGSVISNTFLRRYKNKKFRPLIQYNKSNLFSADTDYNASINVDINKVLTVDNREEPEINKNITLNYELINTLNIESTQYILLLSDVNTSLSILSNINNKIITNNFRIKKNQFLGSKYTQTIKTIKADVNKLIVNENNNI